MGSRTPTHGTSSEKTIEGCIQVMRRRGHLFYLQSLCFQGTLINHFLCIELPNQKTIIYFTKKKNLFFMAARLVTSHLSTDFPPSAKFIPKHIDQCRSPITILIHLRAPIQRFDRAGLITEQRSPRLYELRGLHWG